MPPTKNYGPSLPPQTESPRTVTGQLRWAFAYFGSLLHSICFYESSEAISSWEQIQTTMHSMVSSVCARFSRQPTISTLLPILFIITLPDIPYGRRFIYIFHEIQQSWLYSQSPVLVVFLCMLQWFCKQYHWEINSIIHQRASSRSFPSHYGAEWSALTGKVRT